MCELHVVYPQFLLRVLLCEVVFVSAVLPLLILVHSFESSVFIFCFLLFIIYRYDAIWSPWLIPAQQQCPALLSLLHCKVSQASWKSLQSPNGQPWTGYTT